MRSLFAIEFLDFDYITIAGRKLTKQEYDEKTVDIWPCNQNLILKCSLKGGGKGEYPGSESRLNNYIKEID